jgi:serine protease Do
VNSYRLLASGILTVAAVLVQPQISWSYTSEEIAGIAKDVTVIVDTHNGNGSGVSIGHVGNKYFVLTTWHVIKTTPYRSTNVTITTKDGAKHQINPNSITRLGKLDLGLFSFSSPKTYKVAEIGNSDTLSEGSTLYITGSPVNIVGINTRSLLVVSGQLVGFDSPTDKQGYTLIYNNNTQPGMSGGSILDKNGRLVGIHGMGARKQDDLNIRVGFNLGIPINSFMNGFSQFLHLIGPSNPKVRAGSTVTSPTIDRSQNKTEACVGEKC